MLLHVLALAALAAVPPQITGTVTYRQRSALPPGAAVHVELQDVSRADARALVVAETTLLAGTAQVPIPFAFAYAPTAIDQGHRYVVRATIRLDDRTIFTSDTAYPVLTDGAPANVDIVVVPVSSAATDLAPSPTFGSTTWTLRELDGKPVAASADERPATLQFDETAKRIAGSGGCNRIIGTFDRSGSTLAIVPGGMTRMACPEPAMTQERAFDEALRATKIYRITGDELELRGADDRVLARFTGRGAERQSPTR